MPTDFGLHNIDVSKSPVPQHALLASAKPVIKSKLSFLEITSANGTSGTNERRLTVVGGFGDNVKERLINVEHHNLKARQLSLQALARCIQFIVERNGIVV